MSLPGAIDKAKIKDYKVTAYTLQGCVHCTHLHELLDRSSIDNSRAFLMH